MKAKCSDELLAETIREIGVTGAAVKLGISVRATCSRRRRIEERTGVAIKPRSNCPPPPKPTAYPARVPIDVQNGVILVGSDAHYWPDTVDPGHLAMLTLIEELKPKVVIMNGDVFDGASISRHPPLGWERKPTVQEELEAVEERLHEIAVASEGAKLFWTLGNHDARFEMKLAAQAPQFEGVPGFCLRDRFPLWEMAMSLWVNGNELVVKHRYKGGVHATHNNALSSGRSMVTGHLHSLKVTPFSDYNGTRYGVDSGTLSNPYGPHAAYGEDNPLNHRSGLVALTFVDGKLLWPELAAAIDHHHFQFRGKIYEV